MVIPEMESRKNNGACSLAFLKPHLGAAALAIAPGSGKTRLIVFVHGGHGDHITTWANHDAKTYWPKLVRDDTVNFGLVDVAVFDYRSPVQEKAPGVRNISNSLRDLLRESNATDYDDIVFVAHSLGGVVTRKLLVDFATDENPLLGKTRLVASMACAYGGSVLLELIDRVGSENEHMEDVKTGSAFLNDLNAAWEKLRNEASPQQRQRPFVLSMWSGKDFVVTRNHAQLGCDIVLLMKTVTDSLIVTDEQEEWAIQSLTPWDTFPDMPITKREELFPKKLRQARPGANDDLDHIDIVKPDNVDHAAHLALRDAFRLAVSNS